MFGVQKCLNAGYGEQGRERFCNPVARLKSHVLGLGEGWTWVEGEAGRIKACYRSALCTAVSLWEGLDGCRRGGACKHWVVWAASWTWYSNTLQLSGWQSCFFGRSDRHFGWGWNRLKSDELPLNGVQWFVFPRGWIKDHLMILWLYLVPTGHKSRLSSEVAHHHCDGLAQICRDDHGPQRMNPNVSDEPLTSYLAPPTGQISQWNISTTTGGIDTDCITIHGPQQINHTIAMRTIISPVSFSCAEQMLACLSAKLRWWTLAVILSVLADC